MKFWGIFRFELAYQLRRPWPWLCLAVVLVVAFLMTRDSAVADALYDDFLVNSPFAIANATVIGTLLWLLVAPFIAGEAGARDVATGMHPLAWTAPIRKRDYLGSRFLAALLLNALILLAVPLGILLAVYSPGVNPEAIGPFMPAAYVTAYAFIALPNAFVATAIQFALAVRSGRPTASYLGSVLLVFTGFFVATAVRFLLDQRLGMLLDPIGINFIIEDLAHLWTPTEKKFRLLALEGTVLWNRLLWTGVGLTALAVTCLHFRFAHRVPSEWWRRWIGHRGAQAPAPAGTVITAISVARVSQRFGAAIQARQTLAIAWRSFRAMATGLPGLAFLAGIPLMTVLVLLDQMGTMGTALIPTTARVIMELTGPLSVTMAAEPSRWVIVPLFIAFFAGELVWRERDAGLGEITDAMPGSEWTPLIGKLLGLGLLLAAFMTALTAAGMLAQAIMGYGEFEIVLYLAALFALQLPEYLLYAVVALVVHVLVDQKYAGHLVAVMVYMFVALLAGTLGIEHNLLVYGASPGWSYTEMRGFGPFVTPWLWFKLYWAAWAVLLAVVARLLWMRGRESGLDVRVRLARGRFTRATACLAAAAVALVLVLGGFVFYNTNVVNDYLSDAEIKDRRAEYERRYRRYENIPQPRLAGTDLRVEIHPARRAVEIRGSYRLVNSGSTAIDSIHLATPMGGVRTRAVTLDRAARLAVDDEEHDYRIYHLERPLEPGDSVRLAFEVLVEPRGFANHGVGHFLVEGGTYFTSEAWFPLVGYQRFRELLSVADRRARGLEPRAVLASLYEIEGSEPASRGGGTAFNAVVGTDAGHVAVAPGALRRSWTEGGRRYFHYTTDAPISSEWAFFSARYAVRAGRWNDVAIRIYHNPEHTAHLDGMMRSVQSSLEYYSVHFGPYPYGHLTVVEHPGAPGTGAHADPSIISHGQGFPLLTPRDSGSFDFPFFVMAHEMAHQWTVPYALAEGLPFLSEGLATFFAMRAAEAARGRGQLERVLAFMREPYPFPPIRHGEPLLRALDPYLSRRKGPLAMYALSEYVGSDRVNAAIRRLIEKHDATGAPPATTLDLYRELRAVTPDSLRSLLHDLFEVNAIWEFRAERVEAVATSAGAWQVTLDLWARKSVYDTAGVETDVLLDEWVPIGVFGAVAEGARELRAPLYVQKHRIRSGRQTISVTVPRRPALAGIDPYHLLDWTEGDDDDNIAVVETAE